MIKINTKYIQQIERAASLSDLFPLLQNAIMLEHATIPAYLTAMMSIQAGTNKNVYDIIHSVVIEEMLHMSIACNILNALGGTPAINVPGFIPTYPGPLPMGIDNDLTVQLVPLSLKAVHDIFMAIEEPEDPLGFPVRTEALATPEVFYNTIGSFYHAMQAAIERLAPDRLPGDPAKQMTQIFQPPELFPILRKQDAVNAIKIIIEQGEGTSTNPLDLEGDVAHYYRFAEIYYGKRLVYDKSEPKGYSYSGAPVILDSSTINNIYANTKPADIPAGTEAWNAASEFSQAYSRLLNALHVTFNGSPDNISTTLGMMYDVKICGQKLAAMPFPGKEGFTVGPCFEYAPFLP